MGYFIIYLFGAVSGVLGTILWAAFYSSGNQTRAEEAEEQNKHK